MRRKPYRMLPDLLLIGALAALGLAVFAFARGGWGGSAASGQTGAQPAARATAIASTQPVSVTLTIPANATPTRDYAPPTFDPAEPTVDDIGVDRPTPSGLSPIQPTPKPSDPFQLSICSARPRNVKVLTTSAPVIALVAVQQVLSPRWTTEDGQRPENPWLGKYGIVTPVTFKVEQYLKGKQIETEFQVLISQGMIGQDSVNLCGDEDLSNFQVGQRILVFLTGSRNSSSNTTNWSIAERYNITSDGQVSNSYQNAPLSQIITEIQTTMSRSQVSRDGAYV